MVKGKNLNMAITYHKYKAKMEEAAMKNALAYNTVVLKYHNKNRTQYWMLYNFKLERLSTKCLFLLCRSISDVDKSFKSLSMLKNFFSSSLTIGK